MKSASHDPVLRRQPWQERAQRRRGHLRLRLRPRMIVARPEIGAEAAVRRLKARQRRSVARMRSPQQQKRLRGAVGVRRTPRIVAPSALPAAIALQELRGGFHGKPGLVPHCMRGLADAARDIGGRPRIGDADIREIKVAPCAVAVLSRREKIEAAPDRARGCHCSGSMRDVALSPARTSIRPRPRGMNVRTP